MRNMAGVAVMIGAALAAGCTLDNDTVRHPQWISQLPDGGDPAQLPWQQLADYEVRDLRDFFD